MNNVKKSRAKKLHSLALTFGLSAASLTSVTHGTSQAAPQAVEYLGQTYVIQSVYGNYNSVSSALLATPWYNSAGPWYDGGSPQFRFNPGLVAGDTAQGSEYKVFTDNYLNSFTVYGSSPQFRNGGGVSWLFVPSYLNNEFQYYWIILATGPSGDATAAAMDVNARALRSVMDRRLSGLAMMTSYDCQTFDKHGVCASFQARYSNFDSFNEGAGVLTAAYRVTPQVRFGTFIDYRASETEPTNIKFSNDLPTFGAFVGYSQHLNGTGLQGKVLAAVQNGNATVTRDNSLSSTEPGSGKGSLNSYMVSGELGWGFAVSPSMLTTPYVGVRYTDATRGSYSEDTVTGTVDYPISYNAFSQRLTTATAGVRLAGMLTEKVGYQIGAGIEHDLQQKTSTYSGTSTISGLETFAINVDGVKNRTRGVGSVGMFYQVEKNQRLMGNVSIRNQAYTSQTAVSAMAGYQVAF